MPVPFEHRQGDVADMLDIAVEPQVFVENEVSGASTVLEVVGPDRIGFLYAVTHALSEQGLTIASAHISTYGTQAVDVFYLKDFFGMKIEHPDRIRQLKDAILGAINAWGSPKA